MNKTNQIDTVMDEMQKRIFLDRERQMEASTEIIYDERNRCQGGTTININISPVITTSSNATETTKNSPIREIGGVLGSIAGIFK